MSDEDNPAVDSSLTSPFDLTQDQMREMGYAVVDMIINHFQNTEQTRPTTLCSRKEMDWLLQEPIPQTGSDAMEVLKHVQENIVSHSAHLGHPKFYSFVPSPNNIVSTFADALATGFNLFSGAWVSSPGAAEIEILTMNWLLQLFGLPVVEGGGLFVSGGSMANLTAMATARHCKLAEKFDQGVIYWSDQTHSSVERAALVIGLRKDQLRILPSDDQFRIQVDALKEAVEQDVAAGKKPFLVVANSGTTNTGAVDPLFQISTVCRHHNLWMHVDGAYGGASILSDDGKKALAGIELADSITIDPHKWFHQPFEIGCLMVRDKTQLAGTFRTRPVYLRDLAGAAEEVNFYDHGIQLTRRFRALKFYMSMKTFGLETFQKSVTQAIDLAKWLQTELETRPHWEVITDPSLAVITFRLRPEGQDLSEEELDRLNQKVSDKIIADGKAMLATTKVHNKTVLRMCLINHRTKRKHILETLQDLESYGNVST